MIMLRNFKEINRLQRVFCDQHKACYLRSLSTGHHSNSDWSHNSRHNSRNAMFLKTIAAATVGITSYGLYVYGEKNSSSIAECKSIKKSTTTSPSGDIDPGAFRADLPTFTADEVSEHYDPDESIWMTYKQGVYDVTKFLASHPGDDKILMAAGARVDPFWTLYPIHKNPHVYMTLEQYRIGNIDIDKDAKDDFTDQFVNQPAKKCKLITRSEKPYNAETPAPLLCNSFITPNNLFYVRSHFAVPAPYKHITFVNVDKSKQTVNLNDLSNDYKQHSVIAAVQCCGNRRAEMHAFKPVKGGVWAAGSIGCAEWTGVKLADVLQRMGVDEDTTKYKHVIFEGGDGDGAGTIYSASVPLEMAMDPRRDILICTQMNGEPLPRSHGGPARVLVPGVIGARQVKWVRRIILSEVESDSQWQKNDYKVVPASSTEAMSTQPPIYTYPVQSSICTPEHDSTLPANTPAKIAVEGYAWSGGGRGIRTVELSMDDGATWISTTLTTTPQPHLRRWAWSLYRGEIDVPSRPSGDSITILARAVDDSYCSQHRQVAWIWNARGLLHHTIPECTLHFK